jgi:hypothetical protein
MPERIEVELDSATAAYLRQRCVRRGDLGAAAAAALHELAIADAARADAAWQARHTTEILTLVTDGETALDEAV